MDNHSYNLLKAISKRADAIWMYQQYKEDSKDCKECMKLWDELEREDKRLLKEMKRLLSTHVEKIDSKRPKTDIHKMHPYRYQ